MNRTQFASPMTLRISDEMYEEVAKIAKLEGRSVSDVIRQAIDEYIQRCKQDPEFQRRLRAYMAEQERIYERLSA